MSDALMTRLAELPTAEPDSIRAERIRTRCRRHLAQHAPRATRPATANARVWQPLLATLGVAYLLAAIAEAVSVLSSNF
jgi:hypothetical protein